jgi:hypothetical protein
MLQGDDVGGAPQLDFGVWRALLRSDCGGSIGLPRLVSSRHVRRLLAGRGTACGELIDSHRARAGRVSGGDAVRAGTGKSASPARDVAFRAS